MPADEYAVAGGGALKLKGGKVQKTKKKKKTTTTNKEGGSNLERSLAVVEGESSKNVAEKQGKKKQRNEAKDTKSPENSDNDDGGENVADHKTEAERRHEEIQRRKLLKMFEDGTARPELLKTHKERVEGLNTYLSKLSEHHDMPKIGPG